MTSRKSILIPLGIPTLNETAKEKGIETAEKDEIIERAEMNGLYLLPQLKWEN